MLHLAHCLKAWNTPAFNAQLKRELEALPVDALPLQQGLTYSSHVLDAPFQVRIITLEADADTLSAHLGVFYAGIVAGCSCADDPTPIEPLQEYCELQLTLDRASGAARIDLLPD